MSKIKIAFSGIGGVGGYYGGRMAAHYADSEQVDIYFIGRGENLKAIQDKGLTLRIEAILRRTSVKRTRDKTNFTIGKYTFDSMKQVLAGPGGSRKLTTKENGLLALLCKNANDILQRDYALSTIWVEEGQFKARSMDVYIAKLRSFLKDDPDVEIINIHGQGYKLVCPVNEEEE